MCKCIIDMSTVFVIYFHTHLNVYNVLVLSQDLCAFGGFSIIYIYIYICYVGIFFFTLDAGLLARNQYSKGPATGHLDTGFSLFPCAQKANAEMVPKIPSCHYMLLM